MTIYGLHYFKKDTRISEANRHLLMKQIIFGEQSGFAFRCFSFWENVVDFCCYCVMLCKFAMVSVCSAFIITCRTEVEYAWNDYCICMFPKKPCINVQRTLDTRLALF